MVVVSDLTPVQHGNCVHARTARDDELRDRYPQQCERQLFPHVYDNLDQIRTVCGQ
jgi:hypothetical protein